MKTEEEHPRLDQDDAPLTPRTRYFGINEVDGDFVAPPIPEPIVNEEEALCCCSQCLEFSI
ncbi:MAG TPA: hypothetical protein VM008_17440 [Phycisphaerae bacterium]|nr:hypothetical protein [Phycisphaerae bacterium]